MGHYTKLYGNTTCDYNDKYLCVFFFHSPWPEHRSILYIVLGQVGIRCGWSFQRVSFHKTGIQRRSVSRFSYRQTYIYLVHYCSCLFAQTTYTANIFRAISWSLLSFFIIFILLKISLLFFQEYSFVHTLTLAFGMRTSQKVFSIYRRNIRHHVIHG